MAYTTEQQVINDWKQELAAVKKLTEIKEWAERAFEEAKIWPDATAVLTDLLEKLK